MSTTEARKGKTIHVCLDLGGVLRMGNRQIADEFGGVIRVDGRLLNDPDEIRTAFLREARKGYRVIPLGPCNDFDPRSGCRGHFSEAEGDCCGSDQPEGAGAPRLSSDNAPAGTFEECDYCDGFGTVEVGKPRLSNCPKCAGVGFIDVDVVVVRHAGITITVGAGRSIDGPESDFDTDTDTDTEPA